MTNRLLFPAMVVITIALSAASWHYFGARPSGILRAKPAEVMDWLPLILRLHIACGMLAMAGGAALVFTSSRSHLHRVHRWLGRGYGLSVLFGGLMAAVIAPYAIGGLISCLGFLGMTVVWLYFSGQAVYLAIKGDIISHRKAATYSLALTYTSLTFRLFLLIPLLTSLPFVPVYRFASWASWLIHLGLVAWWLRRTATSKTSLSTSKLELS